MKRIKDNIVFGKSGSSMVEVLVAFLIVAMTVAGFTKVITSSSEMLTKSRAYIAQTVNFDKEFYKKDVAKTEIDGNMEIIVNAGKRLTLTEGKVKKVSKAGVTRYTVDMKKNQEEANDSNKGSGSE